MTAFSPAFSLIGRILIAFMFVTSGWAKITGYAGTGPNTWNRPACRGSCCRS